MRRSHWIGRAWTTLRGAAACHRGHNLSTWLEALNAQRTWDHAVDSHHPAVQPQKSSENRFGFEKAICKNVDFSDSVKCSNLHWFCPSRPSSGHKQLQAPRKWQRPTDEADPWMSPLALRRKPSCSSLDQNKLRHFLQGSAGAKWTPQSHCGVCLR